MDDTRPNWPHQATTRMYAHPSGQWAKKIKGKMIYFGVWADPDGALKRYLAFAQNQPREAAPPAPERITLFVAANAWLNARLSDVDAGRLSPGQFVRYRNIVKKLFAALDRQRVLTDLHPSDFATLRGQLGGGPVTLKNRITWLRTLFNWCEDYYGCHIRFGDQFDKPSAAELRRATGRRALWTAADLRAVLGVAPPTLRCFILLGINCAFGQMDCATLRPEYLHGDYHDFPRGKTGIARVCPLWPETRAALDAYQRPSLELPHLFFVTRFGQPFVRERIAEDASGMAHKAIYIDAIGQELDKACKVAKVEPKPFYAIRHTAASVMAEVGDLHARELIMGHLSPGMAGVYVQLVGQRQARLRVLTDHVHSWLWPKKQSPSSRSGGSRRASRRPAR